MWVLMPKYSSDISECLRAQGVPVPIIDLSKRLEMKLQVKENHRRLKVVYDTGLVVFTQEYPLTGEEVVQRHPFFGDILVSLKKIAGKYVLCERLPYKWASITMLQRKGGVMELYKGSMNNSGKSYGVSLQTYKKVKTR